MNKLEIWYNSLTDKRLCIIWSILAVFDFFVFVSDMVLMSWWVLASIPVTLISIYLANSYYAKYTKSTI